MDILGVGLLRALGGFEEHHAVDVEPKVSIELCSAFWSSAFAGSTVEVGGCNLNRR